VKMTMKVRVEVMDEEGLKTSMEKEGDLQSEALKPITIRSIIRFLEDQLSSSSVKNPYEYEGEDLTIKERVASFLRYDERAPKGWFTSSQLRRIYEEVFGENVRLSTVSTYLSNMYSGGILERKGSRAMRQYRLFHTESMETASAVDVV